MYYIDVSYYISIFMAIIKFQLIACNNVDTDLYFVITIYIYIYIYIILHHINIRCFLNS